LSYYVNFYPLEDFFLILSVEGLDLSLLLVEKDNLGFNDNS